MAYATKERKKERIKLQDEKYWIDIITDLRYGDVKGFAQVNEAGDVDFIAAADKFLETIIVDWNLDDDDGNKLEITPDNINQLMQPDAELLLNRVGGLVTQAKDEEKKSSSKS